MYQARPIIVMGKQRRSFENDGGVKAGSEGKLPKRRLKKVSCPNCNSTFPNKGALMQHCMYKHHAKPRRGKKKTKNQLQPAAYTELKLKFRRQMEKTQLHPGHRSVLFNRLEQIPEKESRDESLKCQAQREHAHVIVSRMPRSTP